MARNLLWSVAVATSLCAVLPRPARAEPGCKQVVGQSSSWTWCENRFTRMSPSERASLATGHAPALDPVVGDGGQGPAPTPPHRAPPGGSAGDFSFSWHDLDGSDWLTGVRDQGQCGACFVFGSLAAVESQYKWLVGDPLLEIDLSEQSVISCISLGSCDSGGTAQEVGMRLKSDGVTDEACYPYTATDGDCGSLCADAADRTSYVTDWHMSYLPWSVDEIKAQLVYGPIVANMQVYSDFYGYQSGVYSRAGDATAEGWHVVAIVGWDDADQSWIARNSWDDDFGDGGYFKITRATDCSLLLDGVCFASNITYFDVELGDVPGLLCGAEREIVLEVEQGESAAASLQVDNCGVTHSVRLNGEATPAAPWLEWSAQQESLAVGEQTTIELDANSAALEPGTHETTLRLEGGSGVVAVRVTFIVNALPEPPPGEGGAPGAGGAAGGPIVPQSSTPPKAAADDGGCGCRLANTLPGGGAGAALGGVLGLALWARRRRGGRSR